MNEESKHISKQAKAFTSGFYITWWLIGSVLLVFPVWELINSYRRQRGNSTSLTLSQYVIARAEQQHKGWRVFRIAFPILIALVGVWLLFHFEGLCGEWGLVCELSRRV